MAVTSFLLVARFGGPLTAMLQFHAQVKWQAVADVKRGLTAIAGRPRRWGCSNGLNRHAISANMVS
jgi:hypothetical protein